MVLKKGLYFMARIQFDMKSIFCINPYFKVIVNKNSP